MDSNERSLALIAEREAVVHATPEQAVPTLPAGDLATLEQRAQEAGRRIAAAVARRERARPRQLRGLVGDDRRERTYYCCGACGHSAVPLDAELGRGDARRGGRAWWRGRRSRRPSRRR
ncbi:MAG TPA: hypothetical protein VFE42_10210 [Chloroflexota bacterium]|nr:hypothetical protein [Chloroflexota bacterium]